MGAGLGLGQLEKREKTCKSSTAAGHQMHVVAECKTSAAREILSAIAEELAAADAPKIGLEVVEDIGEQYSMRRWVQDLQRHECVAVSLAETHGKRLN